MQKQRTDAEAALSPELTARWEEFDEAKQALGRLVIGVDHETFNRRPEAGTWSMAECVDHLIQTGRRVIPRLQRSIDRARSKGHRAEGPFRYSAFENWFARMAGDGRLPPPKRFKVPRVYAPFPGLEVRIEESVRSFEQLQDHYQELLRQARDLDLARAKARSPAFWPIRLSLGVWFRLLSGHQRRHLWQAAQVRSRLTAGRG